MPALRDYLEQSDFSAGMVLDVAPHLIPPDGALNIVNGVPLLSDGSLYLRGRTTWKSNAALNASLRAIWDTYFDAGQRTVVASNSNFGVLDADDATPINLALSGLAFPRPASLIESMLFIDGNPGTIYSGSRMSAATYTTGTIATTNGSKVVTGTSTAWVGSVDAGSLLEIGNERLYVVASVDSNTQITLRDAYEGSTGSGKTYTINRIYNLELNDPYAGASTGNMLFHVAANRLFKVHSGAPNELWFSEVIKPHDYTNQFNTNNFHRLPVGMLGLTSVGHTLLIFTVDGLWTLTGIALDIVDSAGNPQHSLNQLSSDLVLWGNAGIAQWEHTVVAPCTSGIYLLDGVSGPVPISNSIEPLYSAYVEGGHRAGGAIVFGGYYVLPILSSANTVVDVLVCRLTRQALDRRFEVAFPWSRMGGHAAKMCAFTQRIAGLAVGTGSANRTAGPASGGTFASDSGYGVASWSSPSNASSENDTGAQALTYASQTQSPGTAVNDTSHGSAAWSNPGNVASSDNIRATCVVPGVGASNYLKATNFGFSIPSTATIKGVKVEVERSDQGPLGDDLEDNRIRLVRAGAIQGEVDYSKVGVDWPDVTDAYATYGGSNDMWEEEDLTPADINNSGFGFALAVNTMDTDQSITAAVDHIRITVYYVVDSEYLKATNFGFNLPTTATVKGIKVEVRRKTSGGGKDARVRLVKGGVVQSTDKASTAAWPTSFAYKSYGGDGDLWGGSWLYSDINNIGFGVVVASKGQNWLQDNQIDHIRITVYYVDSGSPADPDPSLPQLLGADASSGRVVTCTDFFDPDAPEGVTPGLDADGTTPQLEVIPREIETGNGTKNVVRSLNTDYILSTADAGSPPTLSLEYSDGDDGFLSIGSAPASDGDDPYRLPINKSLRRIRLRLRTVGKTTKAVLRQVELATRPSGATRR